MSSGHLTPPGRSGLSETLARALKARWKSYCKALKRCQRKFSAGSVHQSRIETRRLLALLELLGAFLPEAHLQKARRALKRHLKGFADLRDTQVQRELAARLLPRFPDLEPFEAALCRRERRCVKQARKEIRRVKADRLRRLIRDLADEVRARPEGEVWTRSLRAMDRAFVEVAARRQRVNPEDAETIHRTRIAFKHFRYMVEGLREALPRAPKSRLRAMQAYQSLMGEVQDNEVLGASLAAFARKHDLAAGPARRWLAEQQRQRRRLIARYLKRAGQLDSFRALIPRAPVLRSTPTRQP